MSDILEANNLYTPEAVGNPHTIVVNLKMDKRTHFRKRNDDDYNLGLEVQLGIRRLCEESTSGERVDKLLSGMRPRTEPGTISGDIELDSKLIILHMMQDEEDYAFRWFKDQDVNSDSPQTFVQILDNLNRFGIEDTEEKRQDYLTSHQPYFWQNVGWPDEKTESTYLLIFPSEGLVRNVVDKFAKTYQYKYDQNTIIGEGAPAMNERQKYLVKIDWI